MQFAYRSECPAYQIEYGKPGVKEKKEVVEEVEHAVKLMVAV
jgi:hypothetical protein